ncbi:MAG TPA: S-layer homology domain-containing protein, partial [Clostridiales bacterium]|nr:S-layer homology domain-containing protein [Clostridiales bacterium]
MNKYIIGFPDNTFRANRIVSREQAASIAARINELADDKEAANKFYDYRDISDWAKGYVGAAVSAN